MRRCQVRVCSHGLARDGLLERPAEKRESAHAHVRSSRMAQGAFAALPPHPALSPRMRVFVAGERRAVNAPAACLAALVHGL